MPVTQRPYFGTSSMMVWPPATGNPGLRRFLRAAAQDLVQHFQRQHVGRKGRDGEPEDRGRAHGVDVGDRVRRRDGAEEIGIVDDRREEIDGLRDGLIAADAQHGGIVVGGVSDEKIPQPFLGRELREDGSQVILTQLAGSTAGGGEGGERRVGRAEFVSHVQDLYVKKGELAPAFFMTRRNELRSWPALPPRSRRPRRR